MVDHMKGTGSERIDKDALRAARTRRKLSQHELSVRAGVGQPYISRLESGRREMIRRLPLMSLAAALAIPPSDLILVDRKE